MSDQSPQEKIANDPDPAAKQDVDAVSESVPTESAPEAPSADDAITAAEADRDQYKNALQHLQADFENFKKRTTKQQGEFAERANENFVGKLLPVLDTMELAKAHEPNGSLEQVAVALLEVLNKEGLERMVVVDAAFDPNEHEAVAHEEGEDGPKVSEEFRAGYRWKGRVLRPAMVKVIG